MDRTKVEEYKKLSLEEIEKRIKANCDILDKIGKDDYRESWEEYCKKCNPYWEDNKCLYTVESLFLPREQVRMRPLKDWEKDDEWVHIKIEVFKQWCEDGFTTSYDGIGYYATETEVSDLSALTYAFHDGYIRDDFTHVCWYNK